jgi:hypothetical protein
LELHPAAAAVDAVICLVLEPVPRAVSLSIRAIAGRRRRPFSPESSVHDWPPFNERHRSSQKRLVYVGLEAE